MLFDNPVFPLHRFAGGAPAGCPLGISMPLVSSHIERPALPLSTIQMGTPSFQRQVGLAALLAVALMFAPSSLAQQGLGTVPSDYVPSATARTSAVQALTPTATQTGFITVSIDGCGSASATCTTDVEKPPGATVRAAYMAASTNSNFIIPNGGMTINGSPVNWDAQVSTAAGPSFPNYFSSHFANVTAIVAPIVDAAAAGIVPLTIGEGSSSQIDGSTVVVVFDDPGQTVTSSVVLLFGGQATAGDTSALTLAEGFDDAGQNITLSLAIGFSNQSGGQFSLVDVNGQRMTSSAGDFDDGQLSNGALYTVGGLGDDPANPANPNVTNDPDDELYTLDPFLTAGETDITVFSQNPSNDDIIHLATFIIEGTAAIVGEGILLTPLDATNPVGTDHTLTARVQDDDGDPIADRNVDFEVISGPNTGLMGSDMTDAAGEATFTYASTDPGTDVIVARFVSSGGGTITSNQATKTWTDSGAQGCTRDAFLYFSDWDVDPTNDATPDPRGEYAEIANDAGDGTAYDLSGCDFIVFNPFTEIVTYAADAASVLGDGEAYSFANDPTGYNGQAIPLNTLPDNPSVFALVDGDAVAGQSVGTILANTDVVAAVVLTYDGGLFGSVRGGTAASTSNAQALLEALSALYGAVAAEQGGDVDLAVTTTPNPMSGAGTVSFGLAEGGPISVALFDVLGRQVDLLADGPYGPGRHTVDFDASALPVGVYVVRVVTGSEARLARFTIAR